MLIQKYEQFKRILFLIAPFSFNTRLKIKKRSILSSASNSTRMATLKNCEGIPSHLLTFVWKKNMSHYKSLLEICLRSCFNEDILCVSTFTYFICISVISMCMFTKNCSNMLHIYLWTDYNYFSSHGIKCRTTWFKLPDISLCPSCDINIRQYDRLFANSPPTICS